MKIPTCSFQSRVTSQNSLSVDEFRKTIYEFRWQSLFFFFRMYTLFNIYPNTMIHINMNINHIDLPVLKSQDLEFLESEIDDDVLIGEFA